MKLSLRFWPILPFVVLSLVAGAQPVADFTASPLEGCAPLTVYFTDASTGNINSYNWNLGGTPSGVQNPSRTFTAPGTYNISLTVTGPGGTDTKVKNGYVVIYKKPDINFTATLTPTSGCLPLQVQFTPIVTLNQPGPATYTWDFGDGSPTSHGITPVHTYTTTGPFSVTLTVGSQFCDSSVTKPSFITTYTRPVAQFLSDSDYLCSPTGTIKFTNNSSGGPFSSVFWRFGDNTTGNGSPISHTYTTGATTYDVAMIVTDAHGCMDSAKATSYIKKYVFTPSFTSANAVCEGASISFFNTTSGTLSSSEWSYGDGGTDQGTSVAHVYNTSGNFPVTLSTGIGPCVKTLTKSITVNPKPVPTISFSPAIPCPAPVTVTFTATNTNSAITNSLTYDWDFGDGNTALNTNPAADVYQTNGYKTVQVTATDAVTGCAGVTIDDSVAIRKIIPPCLACLHMVFASPQEGCVPLVSDFSASLGSSLPVQPPFTPPAPYPVPIATYNWTFGGGSPATSTSATPQDTFKVIGDYTVTLNGVTANGCTFSDAITVHADGVVKPSFTATPDSVCPNEVVTFYNTTPVVSGTTYSWNLGDTSFAHNNANFLPSIKHSYAKSGSSTIALSTNHNGCDTTISKTDYIFVKPASADFLYRVECPPKKAPFIYGVTFMDGSVGATSWNWDFGDFTTSTLQNPPTHYYNTTGVFQVRLIVSNSIFGCIDTVVRAVTTYNSSLGISANDSSVCLGDEIRLSGLFNGAAAASYSWIFDNNPTQTPYITDNLLDYIFPAAGQHTVTLVTASGPQNTCLDTVTIPDFILVSHPVIKFGASPSPIGCTPFIVTLRDSTKPTATTNIISREWDFGDGSTPLTGNTANPVHTYTTGVYSVKLKVTDNIGCTDELTKTNYIQARKPNAVFNAANGKTTLCARIDSVMFINSSSGVGPLTYLWNFGDGTTSTAFQPKKAYTAAGTYTVRFIVFDTSGCSDTVLLNNYIKVNAPKAGFTMDKSIAACKPLTVNFTNTSSNGAIKYSWDFEPGSPLNALPNPTHTFPNSGIFNVVLTATDANGCIDTAVRQVYVLGYAGAFTTTPSDICAGQATTFSASITNVPKIFWDFDDGTGDTSNSPVITHTYSTPGTYFPIAIFSDGSPNCKSISNAITPVRVDKVTANFSTTVPCVDSPFTLTTTSTALFSQPNSWNWYFTPADNASGPSVRYTFGTSGPHSVTMIAANAWGCRDTLTRDVFINPLPIVDAGPVDTGICPGDTIMLVGHGAVSYQWSSPTAPIICATCEVASVYTAAPTTYYIVGTDANGCKNRDSIVARIQIKTTSSVSKGGDICIGDTFRLYAAGATSYSWQPVRFLDSPNIASPLATPITTTAYVVTAKEGTCLERYDTVVVTVHPTPVFFTAGNDEIINYGSSVILQANSSGIASIKWRPDSTLSCLDCFRPVAKPYVTTKYYAVGYSQWGCADSAEVTVRVRCNGDSVFIPNTFTPNGDGYNDVFYPRGKGFTAMRAVRIYNRWGELVFERQNMTLNDATLGWDGSYKGHTLPPDVYMYTMQTRCDDGGELVEWKGDITLIR